MLLNGPEPTGRELKKFATLLTFDQTCFGTMNTRFIVAEMNCESGAFSLMTTLYGPLALTETISLPAPVSPIRSMILSWRPAVMLYTTSANVGFWPSDHFAACVRISVRVLLHVLHC